MQDDVDHNFVYFVPLLAFSRYTTQRWTCKNHICTTMATSESNATERYISIRPPRKFIAKDTAPSTHPEPSLDFLSRTWTVTHSTLPMWGKAKNVRITYRALPVPSSEPGKTAILLDDEVNSEALVKSFLPRINTIRGQDTAVDGSTSTWDWKGHGWLKIAGGSRWEILGWGESAGNVGDDSEEDCEKWMVTWFAATMFTPMGVDFYSSRTQGMSEKLYQDLRKALQNTAGPEVGSLVAENMFEIKIT